MSMSRITKSGGMFLFITQHMFQYYTFLIQNRHWTTCSRKTKEHHSCLPGTPQSSGKEENKYSKTMKYSCSKIKGSSRNTYKHENVYPENLYDHREFLFVLDICVYNWIYIFMLKTIFQQSPITSAFRIKIENNLMTCKHIGKWPQLSVQS